MSLLSLSGSCMRHGKPDGRQKTVNIYLQNRPWVTKSLKFKVKLVAVMFITDNRKLLEGLKIDCHYSSISAFTGD